MNTGKISYGSPSPAAGSAPCPPCPMETKTANSRRTQGTCAPSRAFARLLVAGGGDVGPPPPFDMNGLARFCPTERAAAIRAERDIPPSSRQPTIFPPASPASGQRGDREGFAAGGPVSSPRTGRGVCHDERAALLDALEE